MINQKLTKKMERKEHRRLKQELIETVYKKHFSKDYLLTHTDRQRRTDAKKIAEQLLAGKNPLLTMRASA